MACAGATWWSPNSTLAWAGLGRGIAPLGDGDLHQRTRRHQPVDHARRAARLRRQRTLGAHQAVGRDGERAFAGRRQPRRIGSARHGTHAKARPHRLEHRRAAHHHAHDHAERRQRVARDPLRETERACRQGRHVERLRDGLEPLVGHRTVALADGAVPDDADARLRAERHQHEQAGRDLDPVRQAVVVGLVQRHGQQHGHAVAPCSGARPAFFQSFEQTFQTFNPEPERANRTNRVHNSLEGEVGSVSVRRFGVQRPGRRVWIDERSPVLFSWVGNRVANSRISGAGHCR